MEVASDARSYAVLLELPEDVLSNELVVAGTSFGEVLDETPSLFELLDDSSLGWAVSTLPLSLSTDFSNGSRLVARNASKILAESSRCSVNVLES